MAKRVKIPGRLESAETGNIVTGADAIMDDEKGKTQVVINSEVDAAIISLAQGKQDALTFDSAPTEDSPNPVTSAGVYTADKVLSDAIEAILLLIPSAASALNKLVDMQTMNSSIATATASFKGTYNLVSDLHLGVDATHEQIGAALDALSLGADNNDYAFVQVPNSATAPTEISKTERYKFNGENWLFEYDLNNSGFTQGQWNAINSGVTSLLVGKLSDLPTNAELTTLLAGKQDNLTFDNVPTAGSPNPVKSGGVYARNNEIVALINALDAAKQDVLTFDNAPVEGSPNPVKSGGVYTAISAVQAAIVALDAAKQNVLTFDSTPTLGSPNPVTSSGIKTELNRIDGNITTLNDLYEALTQSALVIVEPTDTWPVASPATKTIYRVVDRVNTPPQYYSDYMWNGTAMVLMAQYNNAIDDEPAAGSKNLVESQGINRALFLQDTQTHYYILTEADNPGPSMWGGIKNLNICIKSGDKIYLHLKINSLAGGTSGAIGSIHLGDYTTENRLADFYFGYGDTTFERTVEITSQYDIDDLQMWFSNEPRYTSYELDFDVKSDAGVKYDQVIASLNHSIDGRALSNNINTFEDKLLSEPYKYYETSFSAKAGDVIYFNASLTAVSGSGATSCVLADGDNNTIDTLYLNVGIAKTLKITLQNDVSNAKVMFRNEAGLTSPVVSYVISKKPILDHLNIHIEGTSEVQSYIFRIGASKSKEFAFIVKNFTRNGGSSVAINMYGNNGSLLKDAYGDGVYEITTNDDIEYVTLTVYPNGTTSYSADVYILTPELYYVYQTSTQLDVWLPNNIYALKGTTLQLFTCALAPVLNPSNYNLCIEKVDSTDCGVNRGFCYQYEVQNNKSDYRLRFGLQDDHVSHIQEGNTKIVHVSKKSSPASNKNILCIGDSFTDADYWVSELRRLLTGVVTEGYSDSADSPVTADSLTNLTFIGTKDTDLTPNEGYSGWGYRNFATESEGNPFWYNGDVNFTQYCQAHSYSKIDYAIILLGTNYGYEESYVKKVWDALVTHNSSIKVIVAGRCFANPYGAGANGMSYNQTYMQLSSDVHLVNKQFQSLAESDDYKNNFLYVDYNVLCDNFNNMDFFMMDANIRNTEVKVRSSLRPIDNVHPGKKMYWQMADAFRAAVHYWFL